jgi:hypothetical protein
MRVCLFSLLLCFFILSGQVLAQKNWQLVTSSAFGSWYIDPNVKRLPNGNVLYWERRVGGGTFVSQVEVDCVGKQYRTLSQKILDSEDKFGNSVPAVRNVTTMAEIGVWRDIVPTSKGEEMTSLACLTAKRVVPQVDKPTVKKKIVKKKSRKNR